MPTPKAKRRSSRRHFLRGAAGTALAMPLFSSLFPKTTHAQSAVSPVGLFTIVQAVGTATYGWWPETGNGALTEQSFSANHTFAAVSDLRDRMLFVQGIDNVPHLGGCDHNRVIASLLSAQAHRGGGTKGGNAGNTDSIDTLITRISDPGATPFVLLGGKPNGSAYATGTHDAGDPIYGIRRPADAFDVISGIVGGDDEAKAANARRVQRGESILDYVLTEMCDLRRNKLSVADRQKLDGYTEALRSVEKDLAKAAADTCPDPLVDYGPYANTPSDPNQIGEYGKMLVDIGVLAAACGFRQSVTMYMGGEAPTTDWTFVGADCSDHHGLSHHSCSGDNSAAFNQRADDDLHAVDAWHAENLFGRAVRQLADLQGEDGDLLSRYGVLLVNGLSNGRVHDHRNMPCVLAGGMNGYFRQGAMVEVDSGTVFSDQCNDNEETCRPHNNFLAMLGRAAGAELDRFGSDALPDGEHPELRP